MSEDISGSRYRVTPIEWTSIILSLVVVAIILSDRAVNCGLLGDELLFVHAVEVGLPDSLFYAGSSHPPLLRFVVSLIAAPSTAPDWLLRLPSLLCAVSCIFVWHRILLRLVNGVILRSLLLPAISWNPFWLDQAFQVLPYSALVFCSSLHCIAWMRYLENPNAKWRQFALIASAIGLPWIHFFGVNILIASQLIWGVLLWHHRCTGRQWLYTNLTIATMTLPMVPIAVFYIVHDQPYPLIAIDDYWSYFLPFSGYCFSIITFPGLDWHSAVLVIGFYGAAVCYAVRACASGKTSSPGLGDARLIAVAFMLAGLPAAQLHSLISQAAMWPRYMLGGSWIHLPLIVAVLLWAKMNRTATIFSAACCLLAFSQLPDVQSFNNARDYKSIARHIEDHCQPNDAFLAQSMDLWQDNNHFDRIWLERYCDADLALTTGPHLSRQRLFAAGLPLHHLSPDVERLWVYSHLFKKEWLQQQHVKGWRLCQLNQFGGPFPLALFERQSTDDEASVTTSNALQRF